MSGSSLVPIANPVIAPFRNPVGTIAGGFLASAINKTSSLEQILFRTPRAIGYMIPDVVVEEHHDDELVITEHPIEQGASITDHAYSRPPSLSIRCGWSNSSMENQIFALGYGSEDFVQTIYADMLAMQATRIPMLVLTGKRVYRNMLISSVSMETDSRTEYSLLCHIRLRQIIIVQTQTANIGPQANSSDPTNQANPQDTASSVNNGTVQPTANNSVLRSLTNFYGFTKP